MEGNTMRIYVNKADLRSYGYSPELWNGNVICVIVPENFQGGNKSYNPETNTWTTDESRELTEEEAKVVYELERENVLHNSRYTISLWQTKLLMGTISYEDKEKLLDWINYIDLVEKLNIRTHYLPNKDFYE